jgi:hypothetical protein
MVANAEDYSPPVDVGVTETNRLNRVYIPIGNYQLFQNQHNLANRLIYIDEKTDPTDQNSLQQLTYSRQSSADRISLIYHSFFIDAFQNRLATPLKTDLKCFFIHDTIPSYQQALGEKLSYQPIATQETTLSRAPNSEFYVGNAHPILINQQPFLNYLTNQILEELCAIDNAARNINRRDHSEKQVCVVRKHPEITELAKIITTKENFEVVQSHLNFLYSKAYRMVLAQHSFANIGEIMLEPGLYYHAEEILSYSAVLNQDIRLLSINFRLPSQKDFIFVTPDSFLQKKAYEDPENQYTITRDKENEYRRFDQTNYIFPLLTDGRKGDPSVSKKLSLTQESLNNALQSIADPIIKLNLLDEACQYVIDNKHPHSGKPLYTQINVVAKTRYTDTQVNHLMQLRKMFFSICEDIIVPQLSQFSEKELRRFKGVIYASLLMQLPDSEFCRYADRAKAIVYRVEDPAQVTPPKFVPPHPSLVV